MIRQFKPPKVAALDRPQVFQFLTTTYDSCITLSHKGYSLETRRNYQASETNTYNAPPVKYSTNKGKALPVRCREGPQDCETSGTHIF
jgi:hypothetical protein